MKSTSTKLLSSAAALFSPDVLAAASLSLFPLFSPQLLFCSRQKTGCLRLPFLTPLYQFRAVSLGQPACFHRNPIPSTRRGWNLNCSKSGPTVPMLSHFPSAKRNNHRETTNYATALFFPHLPECSPLCLAWAAVLGNSTVFPPLQSSFFSLSTDMRLQTTHSAW